MPVHTDSLSDLIDHYEKVRANNAQWVQYRLLVDGRPATVIIATDEGVAVVDLMIRHYERRGMSVRDPRSAPQPGDGG